MFCDLFRMLLNQMSSHLLLCSFEARHLTSVCIQEGQQTSLLVGNKFVGILSQCLGLQWIWLVDKEKEKIRVFKNTCLVSMKLCISGPER